MRAARAISVVKKSRALSFVQPFSPWIPRASIPSSAKPFSTWGQITGTSSIEVRALDALRNSHASPSGKFTLLNPRHFEHKLDRLREEHKAIQRPFLTDIVVPTLQRAALHETITSAMLSVQFKTEKDFTHHTLQTARELQPLIESKTSEVREADQKSEALVQEALIRVKRGKAVANSAVDTHVAKILTTINHNIQTHTYTPSVDAKVDDLVAQIATNDLRREYRTSIAQSIVSSVLSKKFASKQIDPLFFMRPDHAFTLLVVGGSATGKSTLTRDLLESYRATYSIKPEDISFISADIARLPLLADSDLGNNHADHGTLTQDEASYLSYNMMRKRHEMIQKGLTPHVLCEQLYVNPETINLISSGTMLRVYATFCCPVKALENDHSRFKIANERSTPSECILRSQKLATDNMPTLLHCQTDNLMLEIHDTDARRARAADDEKSISPVAILDKANKRFYVLNILSLLEFIKRSELNPLATCKSTLYPNQQGSSYAACVKKLKKQYGELEMVFVEPNVKALDFHNLDQHVYARHTLKDGLQVENRAVFERQVAAPIGNVMFTTLSDHPTLSSENSHNIGENPNNMLTRR